MYRHTFIIDNGMVINYTHVIYTFVSLMSLKILCGGAQLEDISLIFLAVG